MEKNEALNEYNLLISKAKKDFKNGLYKGKYTEKHHIVPKCVGGADKNDNLVYLLCIDHIKAHILLLDIYPDNGKLLFAINSMFTGYKGEKIERIKAFSEMDIKLVSKLREDYKIYLRKNGIEKDGKIRFKAKQIACMNDNKEIVKIYDSISDTKLDNFHPSSVAKAVRGNRKYGGYYWKDLNIIMKCEKSIYDEYLMRLENNNLPELDLSFTKLSLKEKLKLRPRRKQTEEIRAKISASNKERFSKTKRSKDNKRKINKNKFGLIQVEDKNLNIVFNSLSDAGKYYGVSKNTIKNWIRSGNKNMILRKRKIIGPNNDEYQSLELCSKKYGYSTSTISRWIKNYPEKGFYIKYIN